MKYDLIVGNNNNNNNPREFARKEMNLSREWSTKKGGTIQ